MNGHGNFVEGFLNGCFGSDLQQENSSSQASSWLSKCTSAELYFKTRTYPTLRTIVIPKAAPTAAEMKHVIL